MVQMFMRAFTKVSPLLSVRFRVSALERFYCNGSLGIRPGQDFLSVLEMCPLYRMSALGRFHCIRICDGSISCLSCYVRKI